MSDDMDDILQVFFQECDDQLQELERGLMALSDGATEHETINAVFRAVHSIKGGAASFGLENLVHFAHVFESALDGLRSDRVQPTPEIVKVFLKSMDVLSDLVSEARGGDAVDSARVEESRAELQKIIDSDSGSSGEATTDDVIPTDFVPVAFDFGSDGFDFGEDSASDTSSSSSEALSGSALVVTFCPHDDMYARGDDARNLLKSLEDLAATTPDGTLHVTCDRSNLPVLDAEFNPVKSYLSWRVELPAEIQEDAVHAVFDWVSDVCDFTVTRQGNDPGSGGGGSSKTDTSTENASDSQSNFQPDTLPETTSASATQQSLESSLSAPTQSSSVSAASVQASAKQTASAASQPAAAARKPLEQAVSIRVDLHRIDELMDLVGELVIAQAALSSVCRKDDSSVQRELTESVNAMQILTRDIQDAVMAVRAQPVRTVFQRMQRVVREAASMTNKNVVLILEGEDTEVDRTLVEKLTDPLTHMLRNAVDHGIENADVRLAAGKTAEGHITLSAGHRSGRILITVKDDGGGINRDRVRAVAIEKGIITPDAVLTEEDIDNLLFAPGFSTAQKISDLSGRGVGMDVVKQAIMNLGGRVTISSVPGQGTTFCLSLPLTLAVLDGMLISAGGSIMVIPISSVVETMLMSHQDVYILPEGDNVVSIRGNYMPLVPLAKELGLMNSLPLKEESKETIILIVENEAGARAALIVDAIHDQTQVVIKSIEKNYQQIPGVSAATILGDGSVSLILDVPALIATAIGRIDTKSSNTRSGLAA